MSTKKNFQPLSAFDLSNGASFLFKWTVSRGADTYGYNICTLYINGDRVASCSGGGYDMQGTCLGDWIEAQFPEELKRLEPSWTEGKIYIKCPVCKGAENRTDSFCKKCHSPFGEIHNPNFKRGGLYGLTFDRDGAPYGSVKHWKEGDRIRVDGGCGFSSMEAILRALGYCLKWHNLKSKNQSLYTLETYKGAK